LSVNRASLGLLVLLCSFPVSGWATPYVEIVRRTAPPMPPAARARGFEGRVVVWATVDTAGVPHEVHVRKRGWPDTDSLAVWAARQWRFRITDAETKRPLQRTIGVTVEFADARPRRTRR
jgi:TonB family protein